jgi:ADP-heptose:LPS heptosyltransferase
MSAGPDLKSQTRADRVVIVRAGALGDTLMVTPLIRCLREQNPGREIDLLCSASAAALLATNKHLSRIYALRNRNIPFLFSLEKRRLATQLRRNSYDFAILLESAPHYRELLERAGITRIRSFADIAFNPGKHSVINNLAVGGFEHRETTALDLELNLPEAAVQNASRLLASLPRPILGIHSGYGPASKKKHQTERLRGWHPANFRDVAHDLIEKGAGVVLTGSSGDRAVCEQISRDLRPESVRILAGQTSVLELAAVIRQLDVLISVDSGPAHMAAALGTPLVVLWGPGILDQTAPISSSTPIQILNARVPCAPCYGTERMRTCQRNICMEQIYPRQVVAAALALLRSNNDPRATQYLPELAR